MWVYLNGQILKENEARISPLDRGFTFGDGVYEVIPCYDNRLFLFDEHLKRLKASLELTFIPLSLKEGIKAHMNEARKYHGLEKIK